MKDGREEASRDAGSNVRCGQGIALHFEPLAEEGIDIHGRARGYCCEDHGPIIKGIAATHTSHCYVQ